MCLVLRASETEPVVKRILTSLLYCFMTLLVYACGVGHAAAAPPFSIAFYYASHHPVDEFRAFDKVVVDPDSGISPSVYGKGRSELIAYVSLGEADPNRAYTKKMKPAWFVGANKAWKTKVVDTSNPEWQAFFIEGVIKPLWDAGYRGFFLDTLDSYQLASSGDSVRMQEGMVQTIHEIQRRFPGARLILNRGFEIFGRLKGDVFAVAAESLFQGYSQDKKAYVEVPEKDREWLLARLNEVRSAGVPVIAIDYVPPGRRALARRTAERIRALGIIPWVADKDLASLGVGAIEVMPRKILGLYNGKESRDPYFTRMNLLAVMPLNYLGFTVHLIDMNGPLPDGIAAGRYAGVVIWPDRSEGRKNLASWILGRIGEGVPVVFLDRFGLDGDKGFLTALGLEQRAANRIAPPVRITAKDPRIGFEQQPLPRIEDFRPIGLKEGEPLLRLAAANGPVSDAAAITPWGGYALYPFVVSDKLNDRSFWVLDPFRFFTDALRLPDMPVPDTTTENGARLLMSHVDGDGFESMAEWPGGGLAADELRRKILDKYRLPVTVSVITGVIAPNGLYPARSGRLERAARDIFSLPWVEAASHSFSHPFTWEPDLMSVGSEVEVWHNLKIPGYVFDMDAEIAGSLRYINGRLMPKGKKARMFLWTGNCLPGADAVQKAYRAGTLIALNGGDTTITGTNRSLTQVAPLGIWRNEFFQVFAPNQNENVYTNLWSGNFYGYRRVLETFRLTDLPRRLKPVNIYYHFYSATKEASLGALREVYDWTVSRRMFSIYISEYIEKVLDFNRTVVARDDSGWLVRNSGKLREFRVPTRAGFPDLSEGGNVAGFSDHADSRYLHLAPGGEARIRLDPSPGQVAYLSGANAFLESLGRAGRGMKVTLNGYTPYSVSIGNAEGCSIAGAGRTISVSGKGLKSIELPKGTHALEIRCPKD
jgi:hypothetical protein